MRPAALSLLFLVVVAGCLGGSGVNPSSGGGPPNGTWATDQGINETSLAKQHFEELRAAGSFSRNHTATDAINGAIRPDRPRPDWYSPPKYSHEQVNLDTGRFLHVSVDIGHSRGATFISPEEDAIRRKPCPSDSCSWEYSYLHRSDPDTVTNELGRYRHGRVVEMMVEIMDDWNFTYAGMTNRDGTTVYRYKASWTFDKPVPPFTEEPTGTGMLLVTADGVIQRWETEFTGPAEVTVDGETRTVTITQQDVYRFYDVGTTSVERPDWVEQAKAKDTPPETRTA